MTEDQKEDRPVLIIGHGSLAGAAIAAVFGAALNDALSTSQGFDLLGDPGPRSDARCRSPECALADRAKLNADQPESRQVRRARERKGR